MEEFQVRLVDPGDLDKVARLHSVVHLFAEGLVYAPTKIGDPDTWRVWADRVITEVESFPKGQHDDLVDTVSQAISYMRKQGMIERGVERSFELAESQRFMGNTQATPLYPM
jgi:phage terminase large subunit-like protein